MKSANHDLSEELHLSDPWVEAISSERIGKALEGFSLPFADGWDCDALTVEIQKLARPPIQENPQSNSAAIKELSRLSEKAKALRYGIESMGDTAERAAFFDLLRRMDEENDQSQLDYQNDYLRLMVEPLKLIEYVLARSASQLDLSPPQKPRWTQRLATEKRISFAISLTPVFEQAFDTPARANNWKAEYGEEHAWPDFFRRVHVELYPDETRLNLPEVLQDAARWRPHVSSMREYLEAEKATRGS